MRTILIISIYFSYTFFVQAQSEYTYGGTKNDSGCKIIYTSDSRYLIVANTRSSGTGSNDIMLIKTDTLGNILWQKYIGGISFDFATNAIETSSGNYIVSGYCWSLIDNGFRIDGVIIKLDSNGNIIWQKYFEGSYNEMYFSVKEIHDEELIVIGYSNTVNYDGDIYLNKLNVNGDIEWSRTYESNYVDFGFDVVCANNDDGFLLLGTTKGYLFNSPTIEYYYHDADILLIKTDVSGTEEWRKIYGGNLHDFGKSIISDQNGGYFIMGSTQSYGNGSFDIYLININEFGNIGWEKTYGEGEFEYGESMCIYNNSEIYLCGTTSSYSDDYKTDVIIIKTDFNGNIIWNNIFGGNESDYCYSVASIQEGNVAVLGKTRSFGSGDEDIYLLKINKNGDIIYVSNIFDSTELHAYVFPNPADELLIIEIPKFKSVKYYLSIYDLQGVQIDFYEVKNSYKSEISVSHLKEGVYLYNITLDNGEKYTGKLSIKH
ncbi:MAG TPA: hypothetical protein DDX39_08840 [Bacteroidales bacterium]|nr:MAG: hypothetical protein A2W98_11960 [Bacteroidetes bacterium GWF2_33_38]OFY74696.1 MAG: hypothetical protein A2265_01520 [Bacteroidetes bacterium RIFOXYA12_FULL_33_9]OFY89897.1 MAG: hypothetical protein A2236_07990 [Bacteroidetes bacterium RIFOXYA2_FULL_33_7]HBF88733.1 hypothetical protein [Bacteroidales bacterium]